MYNIICNNILTHNMTTDFVNHCIIAIMDDIKSNALNLNKQTRNTLNNYL